MSVVDEARLQESMGRMVGYMTGGAACPAIWLRDELGLCAALAQGGPRSAEELAADAECNTRLVREWLGGQAAAGLVSYDAEAHKHALSAEAGDGAGR
jgi:hypothetical protein